MQLFIEETYEDMSRRAADLIAAQLIVDPASTLGLATGSTPIGLYADLVEDFQADRISFEQVTTFNLDEYRGLSPEHDQSYRYFMQKNLFDHVDIDPEATSVPDGANPDAEAACESYELAISEAGGIDLQLLGLGHNGHIGFNEPTSSFSSRTRVKTLTQQTRDDNARFFAEGEAVPTHCVTQGLGTIMDAHAIVLVATGEHKADAIAAMVEGPVSASCPASILQFHPKTLIVVDEAAGAKLRYADYFRLAHSTPVPGTTEAGLGNVSAG